MPVLSPSGCGLMMELPSSAVQDAGIKTGTKPRGTSARDRGSILLQLTREGRSIRSNPRERAMANRVPWHLDGDYFENCSCSLMCPCLMSAAAPLTAQPTEGFCNVPLMFHIDAGRFGEIALDGLNVLVILHAPGVMADGNWSAATYIDERANDEQTDALAAIFSGEAGGPMAAFTPLISKNLGVSKVPMTFRIEGKRRSAEIPGILHMSVDPLPTMHPSGEMWVNVGHPVSPDKMGLAVGAAGNTFSDRGMRWDNSGKNGLYASIQWTNQ